MAAETFDLNKRENSPTGLHAVAWYYRGDLEKLSGRSRARAVASFARTVMINAVENIITAAAIGAGLRVYSLPPDLRYFEGAQENGQHWVPYVCAPRDAQRVDELTRFTQNVGNRVYGDNGIHHITVAAIKDNFGGICANYITRLCQSPDVCGRLVLPDSTQGINPGTAWLPYSD